MTWRLWKLLTGRLRPAPASDDLDEARRKRLEAEYELRHTQKRGTAVNTAVGNLRDHQEADAFADLIEQAFARKGATR
jgi:hypothetical protein